MEAGHKRILRSISLALRHELEGWRDENGGWHPGDLERRLAELGIHREKSKPLDEMPHLSGEDRRARVVVDGYLQLGADAGIERDDAVAEFVRESAYTWANRLFALRCMEARSIIEEVILQKAAYAGRSLVHQRFLRKNPDAAAATDDGLFAVLFAEFAARAAELPALFDPQAAAVALRPSVAALKHCVALLSGTESVRSQEPATDEVFSAPDAFGWAYQYWNTEEKDRVFEAVRTKKGTKIEGADIIPATQLYTEPYMVKFLVQNSLGALWMSLHPDSRLCDGWEYYVRDADRAPVETPPGGSSVRDFTFLDPALGSGHFHLEAFDLFFAMYREENPALAPREIAASILNRNLFGIDLDERAVQIAEAALWMKAKDDAPELEAADLDTFHDHLVATNIRLPRGRDHLEAFLRRHPEDAPLRPALELVFRGLEHADELGSLLQIEEPMDRELRRLKAEADASGATSPVQPDMFRSTAVQSALPMGVETYEAWKAGTLDRLKAHFEQEAEAADSVRAFFGVSARKGLALFDLLARHYDVVAANPPYMGSKNMAASVKAYVELHYNAAKRDLYAAFIARSRGLASSCGQVAMVTLSSWLHQGAFAELRSGLLSETGLHLVVRLGRHAFSEADPPGLPVLFTFSLGAPSERQTILSLEHPASMDASKQAALLRQHVIGRTLFRVEQADFARIPGSPVFIGLSERMVGVLASAPRLASLAEVPKGLTTADNDRYLRYTWEVTNSTRWHPYAKGGGYRKWCGMVRTTVDFQFGGARLKASGGAVIRNARFYGHPGLTYTEVARGSFGVRVLDAGTLFDARSPGIFSTGVNSVALMGTLNSRVTGFFFRNLSPGILLDQAYAPSVPLPDSSVFGELEAVAKWALSVKKCIIARDPIESEFEPTSLAFASVRTHLLNTWLEESCLAAVDWYIDRAVAKAHGLTDEELQAIFRRTGEPAAYFSTLASGPDSEAIKSWMPNLPGELAASVTERPIRSCIGSELLKLCSSLRKSLTIDGEIDQESEADEFGVADDAESDESISGRLLVQSESLIERLAAGLELHPISVFWLLKEGIEQEGWRCLPEEKRLTEDRFTVLVLRLLGHRWPKQIESGEPLPVWADRDGVIPLSSGSSEPTLAARMLERLGAEFPGRAPAEIRAEFEETVGTPLEVWLANGFLARHISQFKKRPIAWQLQSEPAALPGRRRSSPTRSPVFACLAYYHRLDADLLPKLRSHYLAVLRTAHETELRTLEALAQPTPDQGARKAELEVLVDELNRFDAKLQAVVETGFGPAPLQPRLRQLAVDDAMLAMKARWLARLRETLQAAPLAEWQTAATALGYHAEFPSWIATAIARLPHHCARAGAESPDAAKLPEDPTPTSLAAVICAETDKMTATAIDLACAEWMHEWDTHVIQPLRARITAANTALETLAAKLETLDRRNTTRVEEIAREQKRLRAEVKSLKAEIKTKIEKAGQLAASIRKWTSPELPKWESWLASGPLFDEVSTLDGHRAAPVTIRDFIQQESFYAPDLNDGVRVNIAPLQRAGLLAADVIAGKDVDKAIADRAEWRADERRWVREGKLPQCGWWTVTPEVTPIAVPTFERPILAPVNYAIAVLIALLKESGGSCATMRLAGAYGLLAEAELMFGNAPSDLSKTVKLWRQRSRKQKVEIGLFRAALDDLRSRDVLVPEERNGRTFERLDERMLATQIEDWIRLDAALAMRTIDSLDAARQEPILEEYPAEERQRWVA